MGCDIHLYKEKMVEGKWVTADKGWCDEYDEGYINVPYENRFTDRDYDLFGLLCDGVRRNHKFAFKGRGLPFNTCEEVKSLSDMWGDDGHSHSYIYLHELKDAWNFLQSQTVKVSGMKDRESLKLLNESIASEKETDWMLLYPYCKWFSSSESEEFSVDVPASFQLSGIKILIDSFDGCDGDNHRIVFWFDN